MAIAIIPWLSSRIYDKLYVDMLGGVFHSQYLYSFYSFLSHTKCTWKPNRHYTDVSVGIAFVEFTLHAYIRLKNKRVSEKIRNWKCLKRIKVTLTGLQGNTLTSEIKMEESVSTTTVVSFREPLLDEGN